jgi:hypothetical protein
MRKQKTAFRPYFFCRNPQELWGDKEISAERNFDKYLIPLYTPVGTYDFETLFARVSQKSNFFLDL